MAQQIFTERRSWSVTTQMIIEAEGCSEKTASSKLNKMMELGLVVKCKEGTKVFYNLKEYEDLPF